MRSPSTLSEKLQSQMKDASQLNFSQKLQKKKKDQFFQKVNKAMNIVTNPYDPFRVSLGLKFLDSSRERKALIDKIATIRYNDKQVKVQAEMNAIQDMARKAHNRFTSLMNNEINFERDYIELKQKEENNLLLPSISRTRSRDISHLNCLSMEFEGLVIGSDKIISECNSRNQSITKRRRENTISISKKKSIARQLSKVISEPYFQRKV